MQIQIFLLYLFLLLLLLFLGLSHSEHTVAEELGSHQLQRLVDLLTVHECEELFLALTSPEEKVFKQLERLSAEKNPLRSRPRTRRDIDKETHCHPALTDWLRIHGEEAYNDRLSLALQQIGRTDIAIEVGKTLNQDITLELQHFVEEYHEQIHKIASQFILPQAEDDHHEETQEHSARQVRSSSWKDLDLVVERKLVPPYQRHVLDGAWPLLCGLIFGFSVALVVGVSVLLFTVCICPVFQFKRHNH